MSKTGIGSDQITDGQIVGYDLNSTGSFQVGKLSVGAEVTGSAGINDVALSSSIVDLGGFYDGQGHGLVVRWGTNDGSDGGYALTVGSLYYFTSGAAGPAGEWFKTDADVEASGSTQLLGVALGHIPTTSGVLLRGLVRVDSSKINNLSAHASYGKPVYVSTTVGEFDFSKPGGNNDFVRVVGYHIAENSAGDCLLYFDPDPTSIVITA
jgi:hypothetical protein